MGVIAKAIVSMLLGIVYFFILITAGFLVLCWPPETFYYWAAMAFYIILVIALALLTWLTRTLWNYSELKYLVIPLLVTLWGIFMLDLALGSQGINFGVRIGLGSITLLPILILVKWFIKLYTSK